ncbi:hypothetical protein JXD38_00215 [candidate division WOR-3 bacterium]|nr:hypothetical protein [candidate division WOR-3 bacterium]
MMSVQTRDYVDVAARARELGCRVPERIALLPGNFSAAAHAGEFCYHAAASHVRSAWKSVRLEDEGPDARDTPGENGTGGDMTQLSSIGIVSQAVEADTDCDSAGVPFVVFFGAGLLAGPPWRLVVALGMVSSVLASRARRAGKRDARLDIVVERPRDCGFACIEYRGDAFGIVPLVRDVRLVWAGK